jgi:hypothetical protein
VSPGRRQGGSGLWLGVLVVLLLAGFAGILLASPRHRAVYFGEPTGPTQTAPSAVVAAVGGGHVPVPDAAGRLRVRITDRVPSRLPAEGVPAGWTLREFVGEPTIELVRADGRLAARLRTEHSSFALHRDVLVDVREFPYLSWSWKATRLPATGDVRDPTRDDQAAQVYVVFPRWPSPRTRSDVIGYVWDSRAPAGTRLTNPRAGNVRIVVVESGAGRLNEWLSYERNVAEDYAALFGRRAPRVGKVAIMVDSNDTRGEAEALFGDLTFARTAQGSVEIPTRVLR